MFENKKGGGKVRKYLVLGIFTLISILLVCNSVAAADTNKNLSISQVHEQIQNNNLSTNKLSTSNSQKNISKNTNQLKNITISGKVVKCTSGKPFSGVTITVKNSGTTMASTTTKKDGTYKVNFQSIYNIFQVTASSTGHIPSTKNVNVTSAKNGRYYGTADFKLGAANIYVDDNWVGLPNGRQVQFYDGTQHTIGSDAFGTIKAGITNVNPDGTVYIADGTYTGSNNRGITIGKDISIIGQSIGNTIIDAQSKNRIFIVSQGYNVKISNITIKNGLRSNSNGGAIQNSGTLTITNCALTNNKASITGLLTTTAVYGGAIYNTGSLTIINSSFTSNSAISGQSNDAFGGAIYSSSTGTLIITDSTFTSNSVSSSAGTAADDGGAIKTYGSLTVTRCSFISNTATDDGGAICIGDEDTSVTNVAITDSTFTGNTATYGGAIWNNGGSSTSPATVTGSNFTSNSATYGGAIRNWDILTIRNSNFTSNHGTYGGAISNNQNSAVLTVTGSNLTSNTATNGGAIYNEAGTAEIHFNRIIGNTGTDIYRSAGTVNAQNNWWGSNTSPSGRVNSGVNISTWLMLNIAASPNSIHVRDTSDITADLTHNNSGTDTSSQGHIPDGIPISFLCTLGTLSSITGMSNGKATAKFTAGIVPGAGSVSATVDGVTVSAPITISPAASLEITQTVNTPVNVGNTVTYTVTVKNNGPNTANNIRIQDILPAGFTATPSVGTYSGGIWTIPSLANLATATLTITGTATSSMAGSTAYNTATELSQTEYTPSPLPTSTAGVYTKKADVALSQTGSYSGNKVTFIVKATNNGPDAATNINIKDLIPTGLTGVTVTPSIGTYDSSTGIWSIPSLANGAFATLNITGTAVPQTTVSNTANRTAQDEYNSEPITSISSVYVLSVDLRVRNYEWYSGRLDTYDYSETPPYVSYVRNYGPDDATNIAIKYTIGNGLIYMGCNLLKGIDRATYDEQTRTLTYYIDYLPNGGTATIIVYLKINATGIRTPELTTNASLLSIDQIESGTYANSEVRRLTVANAADIQVTQDPITYDPVTKKAIIRIHVKNNGPNDATDINIINNLPIGLVYTGHTPGENYSSGIWNINLLRSSLIKTLEIYADVTATSGTLTNTATKINSTPYDWNPANNAQKMNLTLTGSYTPTVDLRVRNYEWYSGRLDTYDYSEAPPYVSYVRNYGPDDATNIAIKYTIGNGLIYMGCNLLKGIDRATYDEQTRTLTYYIDYLPNGGTATIIVYLKINATGIRTPELTTNASLLSIDQIESGTYANSEVRRLTVANAADIQVTQNINGLHGVQINTSQDIVLTITVTNNGPNTATGITIEDLLTGLNYQENDRGATYDPSTGKLTWNITTLNSNETIILHITVRADNAGTYKVTATKTTQTVTYDWNPANNAQTNYIITYENS